jgi:hypothetical protein
MRLAHLELVLVELVLVEVELVEVEQAGEEVQRVSFLLCLSQKLSVHIT